MPRTTAYTLNTAAAAAMLGVSNDTVRRWATTGKLRHVELPSGQLRFSAADVEAVLTPVEPTQAAS